MLTNKDGGVLSRGGGCAKRGRRSSMISLMDSYADLQTVNEHHDVNPPPPPPPPPLLLHPPYSEMIIAAICALKDKDGSSRQAIAKYIEKEYANLPPTHPTLLTNHLKRMKNEGELIMVKHSYMLPPPRSSVSPFQDHHYSVTSIDNNSFADADANANANADVTADVGSNVNTDIGGENLLTPRRKRASSLNHKRQDFGFQPNFCGSEFSAQTDEHGAPGTCSRVCWRGLSILSVYAKSAR
ncbi:putative high mobility group A5 [Tanacetum coccineum]